MKQFEEVIYDNQIRRGYVDASLPPEFRALQLLKVLEELLECLELVEFDAPDDYASVGGESLYKRVMALKEPVRRQFRLGVFGRLDVDKTSASTILKELADVLIPTVCAAESIRNELEDELSVALLSTLAVRKSEADVARGISQPEPASKADERPF